MINFGQIYFENNYKVQISRKKKKTTIKKQNLPKCIGMDSKKRKREKVYYKVKCIL